MNPGLLNLYITLVLAGLLLIGVEIYIPEGVIGLLGGLCLLAAAVIGFFVFPSPWGLLSAVAIVLLSVLAMAAWAFWVPRTRAGRRLTLERDGRDFRLDAPGADLEGREGEAQSTLRPAGVALIDGRRCDVVAEEGTWIEAGARIRVTAVRGTRVIVRPVESAGEAGQKDD